MLWTETRTGDECEKRHIAMWGTTYTVTEAGVTGRTTAEGLYEGDEFWADSITRLKEHPTERLALAKRHLPLPGAFREASIALRAIIRAKRKSRDRYEAELAELHRLGAIASLAPYDDLEMTPYSTFAALDLRPETIGWDEIVGTTDAKWMAEAWPKPRQHTTARVLYPEIVKASAERYANARARMRQETTDWIDQMFAEEQEEEIAQLTLPASAPKRSLLARLLGF